MQHHNQDVEDDPDAAGDKLHEPRQEGNQDEDQFAGEEVAEQPQRERDDFGKVFNDFQGEVDGVKDQLAENAFGFKRVTTQGFDEAERLVVFR